MSDMKVHDEGWNARLRGEALSSNPYPDGSKDHIEWFSAWCDLDHHLTQRDDALRYTLGHER